jgi:molybdate transport system substrate-binding protein
MNFFLVAVLAVATVPGSLASSAPESSGIALPRGSQLSIAAAANLVYVLDDLHAALRTSEPNLALTVTIGASGSLVAQIQNGAPFDVFLSADLDHPQALVNAGHAVEESLMTFATGRLVVWTTRPDLKLDSVNALIQDASIRKIAIANSDTAPYGRAAKQALEHLRIWPEVQMKLIFGENITQTAQFVESGNADVGFVALSLVLSPKLSNRGQWIPVPADLYTPIAQGGVLTRKGAENAAAARYLEFLCSEEARQIFARFGYQVPRDPTGR